VSKIIYRKATLDDAYGIEYVAAHSWKETYYDYMPKEYLDFRIKNIDNKVEIVKEILSNTDSYYVAEIDKKIVGILHYRQAENKKFTDYGYLEAIYVLKNYQGLGIGKELFKIALQGLIDLGYDKMYLECLQGNQAIGFYQKYGGQIIETVDYPIRDFSVKADVLTFNNIEEVLSKMI